MPTKKRIINLLLFLCISMAAFSQTVTVYKIGDLLKRIHNNSDTIYVVNFWATWCKPCVAELPEFEKLNNSQKNNKVKVLLVSMDFKEDLHGKLIPFLQKHNYTSEIVLLDEVNGNSFINQVSEKWTGAIPATLITAYNRGKQEFFEKKLTEELLLEAIQNIQKQ